MLKSFIFLIFLNVLTIPSVVLGSTSEKSGCAKCTSTACGHLNTFMKNCQNCKNLSQPCRKTFCSNHPNLCTKGNIPLNPLSVGTHDGMDSIDRQIKDVCDASLFLKKDEKDRFSTDIKLLNAIDYCFIMETDNRMLLTLRDLAKHYILYDETERKKVPTATLKSAARLDHYVDDWIAHKAFPKADPKAIESILAKGLTTQLSNEVINNIANFIRKNLYEKKGIPTQEKEVIVGGAIGNKSYTITVSALGCVGEPVKAANSPSRHANKPDCVRPTDPKKQYRK